MKIGFLITARLKSTRLRSKLLLDLNGRTVIERVIDRCKLVSDISNIILCTSVNPQDKPLVEVAKTKEIQYYLGSELDVLQRLSDAAEYYNLDYVINITGENPLFSIKHANLVVAQARKKKYDFIHINNLPIGCAVYGLRPEALKLVCEIKQIIDTEIWGPLINRPEIFNVYTIEVDEFFNRPDLRITIDYPEDLEFVSRIYSALNNINTPSLHDVLVKLDQNPELLRIHSHRKQKKVPSEIMEKIESFYQNNHQQIKIIKGKFY